MVVTYEPQAGAETVAEGWIVPGLVDAHCHVGLDENGAVDDETTEQQAITDRDAGALLLRDCGSAADTSWIHDREDLPRLIRAGRHIARTKRYIRNYAHEVEPAELPAYVAQEAQRGDGWVKLVGDWIERDSGDLAPSFPAEAFAEAIRRRARARRQGHRSLLRRGGAARADRRGHRLHRARHRALRGPDRRDGGARDGAGADGDAAEQLPGVRLRGGREVPGVRRAHARPLRRRRDTIMAAYEAGVAIYAGTDAGGVLPHGQISGEVRELADYGFSAEAALGAASWRAREWLGLDGRLSEGTTADFVVFDRDPLQDLSVLAEPACIVLRGRVVA